MHWGQGKEVRRKVAPTLEKVLTVRKDAWQLADREPAVLERSNTVLVTLDFLLWIK